MTTKTEHNTFEQSLAQLESLVQQMESGEMTLEASLTAFEQGVRLTRECQQALSATEQRVNQLMNQGEAVALVPFESKQDGEGEV